MTDHAQAVWFAAPHCIEIRDEPVPPLAADDVRVRTQLSAISHGTEMLVYRGQVSASMALDLPTFRGDFGLPMKYGYALVGHIEACGSAVESVAVGERVFVLHPHQTYCHVPAAFVKPIPATVPTTAAVLAANMETAVNIVLDAAPILGERIVVTGLGVVGLLVVWLLAQYPIQVVAVDTSAQRRQVAQGFGNVTVCHPADLVAVGGTNFDVAIEVSGNPHALDQVIQQMALEGRVVVASWYGSKPVLLDLGSHFHRQRLHLVSSQVGRIAGALSARWDYARRQQVVWQMLSKLPYQDIISHTVPFAQAATAYSLIDTAPETLLQVVLQYDTREG